MNAIKNKGENEFYSNNMSMPAFWSIIFHIGVFIIVSIGFPHFMKEPEPLEMAIAVEMVDLADVSQTNKTDKPKENKEIKPLVEPKPVKKPVYNKSDNVPDLLSSKEPEIEDIPLPVPAGEKPKIDKTIIKKPPKPKNKPRNKPKTNISKPEVKPENKEDFTNLLKSLTPDEPAPEPKSQITEFSQKMTSSEMDNLNRGVEPCWNVNAGGKDAHSLIVELLVFVNQDRTVKEVQIINQAEYSSNSHFRVAAEAARRALLNPRCSTLNLPPEKYERWKKFRYIFNPSNML